VVSGVAINILATGLSAFLMKSLFGAGGHLILEGAPKLSDWSIPLIRDLPFIGPIIGKQTPGVYLAFIAMGVSSYVLFRTPLGLRIRAVGEHPQAADTVGINVYRVRYLGVIISGVLAGFAGSILSIGIGNGFLEGMVSGKGFIAIAAMIFGKWNPVGTMWACLLFGLAEAIQVTANLLGITIPSTLMATFPYILTMLVLAGVVGKATAPAASGIPYEVDKR
jgi:simple sugar transport system permease protein